MFAFPRNSNAWKTQKPGYRLLCAVADTAVEDQDWEFLYLWKTEISRATGKTETETEEAIRAARGEALGTVL